MAATRGTDIWIKHLIVKMIFHRVKQKKSVLLSDFRYPFLSVVERLTRNLPKDQQIKSYTLLKNGSHAPNLDFDEIIEEVLKQYNNGSLNKEKEELAAWNDHKKLKIARKVRGKRKHEIIDLNVPEIGIVTQTMLGE